MTQPQDVTQFMGQAQRLVVLSDALVRLQCEPSSNGSQTCCGAPGNLIDEPHCDTALGRNL